ncbi:hypothetical protein AGMMS50229_19480 [Campylobacterota bacterium]|nr:hypothetical protein AGMMS50229_19480 [Campylobacterota bacterium]
MTILNGTSEILLLIISGAGGSSDGYKGKYRTIAQNINSTYGASVVRTGLAVIGRAERVAHFAATMDAIGAEFGAHSIYIMASSAAASLTAANAYKYPNIKKLLLINPPANINLHLQSNGLKRFNGKAIVLCGDHDPSFAYAPMLTEGNNAALITIANDDHKLSNMPLEEYIKLPEKYLFEDAKPVQI